MSVILKFLLTCGSVHLDNTVLLQDESLKFDPSTHRTSYGLDGLRFAETINYVRLRRCHHLEDALLT
jgi:hypothetical protein